MAVVTSSEYDHVDMTINSTTYRHYLKDNVARDSIADIQSGFDDVKAVVVSSYADLTFPVYAGSYCENDGSLYQANTDILARETWTPGHWTNVGTFASELEGTVKANKAQNLTEAQKQQARNNIGLGNINTLVTGTVKYSEEQNLSSEAMAQARRNIGLENISELVEGTVKYSELQELLEEDKTRIISNISSDLTPTQQETFRENIGIGDVDALISGAVRYDQPQDDLDETKKTQARTNIGAASSAVVSSIQTAISDIQNELSTKERLVSNVVKETGGFRVDFNDDTNKKIELDAGGELQSVVYDSEYFLHFYDKDHNELYDGPFFIQGGGGGGESTVVGSATIDRITDAAVDCIYGNSLNIEFVFTAVNEDEEPVGNGTATWYIGAAAVARNISVPQGNNSFDIGSYLAPGTNQVRLTISVDTGGSRPITKTKTWTVNAVNMYFTWNFDDAQIRSESFRDRWTVYGEINKDTHTLIDNVEQPIQSTLVSGSVQTLDIPKLQHGAHSIERWLTTTVGTTPHSTPHQYHEVIFVSPNNNNPIISIPIKPDPINQYDTIDIPYVVYDPSDITSNIELFVNDVSQGVTSVDRTVQHWYYTPTTHGNHVLKIQCGDVARELTLTVNEVRINISEVGGYTFRFKASEMASNAAVRNWSNGATPNPITVSFSDNFDWINGGLHTETDENNLIQQYLCIKAGTWMKINYKLFAEESKRDGMTFKTIFKVKNCRDYDTQIMHCYGSGIGIRLYAHKAFFNSDATEVSVPYGEDEQIELEYDVYPVPQREGDGNYPYIMAWLDGVITSFRVYGTTDNFIQDSDDIVFGSENCDIYLYMVKAYPTLIDRKQHVDNFITDAPNATEMMRRYNRNDILKQNGEIDYQALAEKNPDCRVWLYDIPYLTYKKKDKVSGCQFRQIWNGGSKYYQITGSGTQAVQGTSSENYVKGAANTDIDFTSLTDGNQNDLLDNGVVDSRFGNNYFVKDPDDPTHAKIFSVVEAQVEARIRDTYTPENAVIRAKVESVNELGPEWVAFETVNDIPTLYINTNDVITKELGAEFVVVTRDQNRVPTHYIKALGLKLNDGSCPISYSNTKVNFASCEQVNNMCNAAWYQMYNPYPSLTARDCMEFNMGVQFIKDSGTIPDNNHWVLWGDNEFHMYSIANMGNSKKNVHVFHDLSNPDEVCIEVNDNGANQMRMVNPDKLTRQQYFAQEDWSGDYFYGMRYPDTKNPRQEVRNAWYDLVWWMAENDPNAATGEPLDVEERYPPYTFRGHDRPGLQVLKGTTVSQYANDDPEKPAYTHDTFERRMAKMLSECEDHMVMDSFIYHYLYLERHTMVDNVAKNNFWSSTDLQHWDLSKAYDMDTSDGNNNQGQLKFDYGLEWNDINPDDGKAVFNGGVSVWFVFCANLYEACRTMFLDREAAGAWSASRYHKFLLEQQRKVPERCWVQCYWYDYIRTYEQGISDEWMTFLDGGQKTHQRSHYETFEEQYDSSKYRGTVAAISNVNFRGYTPPSWGGKVVNVNGSVIRSSASDSGSIVTTVPVNEIITITAKNGDWRNVTYGNNHGYMRIEDIESVEPEAVISLKMYNKIYISINVGTTAMPPMKAERGILYNIPLALEMDVGGTQVVINSGPMIQEISGLEHLFPDTCVFSEATRLRELTIGSAAAGYANTFLRNLALRNNTMLERLYVQNLPNATGSVLNLTNCPNLLYIDATGSGFSSYEFADGGLLEEAILQAPNTITLLNLTHLTDAKFTILDYSRVSTLRHENTPGVSSLAIINRSDNLSVIRLIGVDWITDTAVLNRLLTMRGLDEGGFSGPSVITGEAAISTARQREMDAYGRAWPLLTIDCPSEAIVKEYAIRFYDWDADPEIDEPLYFVYVNAGDMYILSDTDGTIGGQISTPIREETEQSAYVFSRWVGLPTTNVYESHIVRAEYEETEKTFTVRWFNGIGGGKGTELWSEQNVSYGSSITPNIERPTYSDLEVQGIYYVFNGWDKSTGFIRGNTDVVAQWIIGSRPALDSGLTLGEVGTPGHYNWAQIRAIAGTNKCDEYFQPKEHLDFYMGTDFNFMNGNPNDPGYVRSIDLVSEPIFFDKNTAPIVFNGENGNPLIQLFNGTIPRWTLMIDFEHYDEGTLFSCSNNVKLYRNASNTNADSFSFGGTVYSTNVPYHRSVIAIQYNENTPLVAYAAIDGCTYRSDTKTAMGSTYNCFNDDHPENNVIYAPFIRNQEESFDDPLTIGGVASLSGIDNVNLRGHGWVYKAKLWYDWLGEENLRKLAGYPNLFQRFNYTGIKYQDDINSLTTAAGSFLSEMPLPYISYMQDNKTSDSGTNRYHNQGGWMSSWRRLWLNDQYYNALPIPLQSIINDVEVKSTDGGGTSQLPVYAINKTLDKIYLPSAAEMFNFTSTGSVYEAYWEETAYGEPRIITYFAVDSSKGMTSVNHSRLMFNDIPIPDDANYIVMSRDPTTPGLIGMKVYNKKTIWINTNSSESFGYIYIGPDELNKHRILAGRLATDTANFDALGADSEGKTGGKWVNTNYYFSRSAVPNSYGAYEAIGRSGQRYGAYQTRYSGSFIPMFSI